MRTLVRTFGLLMIVASVASCEATPPTAATPTLASVVLLFAQPTRADLSFQLEAYAVDSDGAYRNVTRQAQWSTSSPSALAFVIVSGSPGSIATVQEGRAGVISATFEGKVGQLSMVVPPRRTSVDLALAFFSPPGIGRSSVPLRATLSTTNQIVDVSTAVTWSSSNQSVATIEGGRLTSRGIGTTEVRASLGDLSDYLIMSVLPGSAVR
jgi:hypothetical protein